MSPALVKKAFEKTGIWPFNPDVVLVEMMAPSRETSRTGCLPFTPSTPVRMATNRLEHMLRPSAEITATNLIATDSVGIITALVDSATRQLQDPAIDYLARNSPIKSTAQLPPIPTTSLSPIKRLPHLLHNNAATPLERESIKKLQDATIKEAFLKGKIAGLQSTAILQDAYLQRVQG